MKLKNGEYFTECYTLYEDEFTKERYPTLYFRLYKTYEDYETDNYYEDFEASGFETKDTIASILKLHYGEDVYMD